MLLWTGQGISEIGSAITVIVLPLTAVIALKASTFEVGLLAAAATVPFLLIALPAGLVVDRLAKRWLMLGCDVARMVAIGSVPLAAAAGVLTLGQLYAVALLAGVATVFFDVAYQSYVPSLVGRGQLLDANGKLAATQAFAQVVGPGLGGALFGLVRAGAMTADAFSYAVSSASLLLIRARESVPGHAAGRGRAGEAGQAGRASPARAALRTELLAGAVFVIRHPVLRKIAACTATANLFVAVASAVQIIFLVRVLHVPAAGTGLLLAVGSVGGVAGGLASGRLGRRIGSARIIPVSLLGFGAIGLLIPLTEPGWRLALFPVGFAGFVFAGVIYNIAQLSYRQTICPPELYGRLNAAIRWIVWGTLPLGGVLGGALGTVAGVRTTLWIGCAGTWAAGWWVFFSPLRSMRDIPAASEPEEAPAPPAPPAPGPPSDGDRAA
jgi:MFS family permease